MSATPYKPANLLLLAGDFVEPALAGATCSRISLARLTKTQRYQRVS